MFGNLIGGCHAGPVNASAYAFCCDLHDCCCVAAASQRIHVGIFDHPTSMIAVVTQQQCIQSVGKLTVQLHHMNLWHGESELFRPVVNATLLSDTRQASLQLKS